MPKTSEAGKKAKKVHLDGDDEVAAVLEEVVRVESDDTGLVGLSDIGEHDVDHADEHSVLVRMTGVLDDRNDVGSLLGHVDQVAAGSVRELDCVDQSFLKKARSR